MHTTANRLATASCPVCSSYTAANSRIVANCLLNCKRIENRSVTSAALMFNGHMSLQPESHASARGQEFDHSLGNTRGNIRFIFPLGTPRQCLYCASNARGKSWFLLSFSRLLCQNSVQSFRGSPRTINVTNADMCSDHRWSTSLYDACHSGQSGM